MNLDEQIQKIIGGSPISEWIGEERQRQEDNIELIASENFTSNKVRACMASCLTNKYAEGYPENRSGGRSGRYYGGCNVVDKIEQYCCDKWREVFNTDYHVNVQPHSGSQANQAAYAAVLKPGDTILSLNLDNGGHLSHGSKVNFSGKLYNFIFYGVGNDGRIDVNDFMDKLYNCKPNMILVGASAYPRELDFKEFEVHLKKFQDFYGWRPIFMVDMAHIAGLVAAGQHQSPFGIADIITTTTHKTLRGPRGGLIFCKQKYADKIDGAVFPGSQGGPLMHVIAGKAICAEEALEDGFKKYQESVVKNCKAMAEEFIKLGYNLVTNGTDNHLFLIDFSKTHPNITGKMVQDACDEEGITLNKNCVPGESRSPKETSGIRIGTAAMTTKGWKEIDFIACAKEIDKIIKRLNNESSIR